MSRPRQLLWCGWLVAASVQANADQEGSRGSGIGSPPGWQTTLDGFYARGLDARLDTGGEFDVDRFFTGVTPAYRSASGVMAGLGIGVGADNYDFADAGGLAGTTPWRDIRSYRLSAPIRWPVSDGWTGFVIPTVRVTGETGADLDDAVAAGGFAAFTYRFNDRLTLGPGLGVIGQIEDDADIFPIVAVDWRISQRLRLETGRGLGATLGPGIFLNWEHSQRWQFSLGARSERLRFRLDRDGPVPSGIGEDRRYPLALLASYALSPTAQLQLFGGAEFGGRLRLFDESGDRLGADGYESRGFLGVALRARFR